MLQLKNLDKNSSILKYPSNFKHYKKAKYVCDARKVFVRLIVYLRPDISMGVPGTFASYTFFHSSQ